MPTRFLPIMDVVGTLLSAVQTVFAALQCSELKQLCSIFGYESDLQSLERTVDTIKAVLLDAESRQMEVELTHQAKLWVDDLKDALYDADDLVDEFLTLARKKKLMKGGSFTPKVRAIVSRFNSLRIARKVSKGVREITKKLDAIAKNHNQFGFKLDSQRTRHRRVETCSYVFAQDIIGRQVDLEQIVRRLLDPEVQQDQTSCLTIVGIGGLGKTALAQLVYNYPRIQQEFPLRLWTCVSDEKGWDLEVILCKILESAKGHKSDGDPSMDNLQRELRGKLLQKKYLIVLDDVWTEDRHNWITLMGFLRGGLRGSWVIATTRSRITATCISREIHELKGLSDEDSWQLFEKVAFYEDQERGDRLELDEIGREIVKRYCANVPLAIRVVGAALHGQQKREWLLFREVGLRKVMEDANGIEPILKLSYFNLDPPLRTCFSYCAIFPKGYAIYKKVVINLWIAQGYVIPSEAQSIEDTGEQYLLTLLKRCCFQDAMTDKDGEIIYFKMHDLMHDIAQEVAKEEIVRASSFQCTSNNKIRHVYHYRGKGTKSLFTSCKIRTYLRVGRCKPDSPMKFGTVLAKWRSLRVLDLSNSGMNNLPAKLGKLLHLRYLDLSGNNELEMIPNAITKLHNLQVLWLGRCHRLRELPQEVGKFTNLRVLGLSHCKSLKELPKDMGNMSSLRVLGLSYCESLKELPKDIGNLTSLRVLDLSHCKNLKELPRDVGNMTELRVLDAEECKSLTHMPRGIGNLSYLWKLPYFVLGEGSPGNERGQLADHIQEIRALQNLEGKLRLKINIPRSNAEYVVGNGSEGVPLTLSPYLTQIAIVFPSPQSQFWRYPTGDYEIDEKLLEGLQPHPNLTEVKLEWYSGGLMPNWARGENLVVFLPNLVSIHLSHFANLQQLPLFGKLPKLKSLVLHSLVDLEYMENTTISRRNDSSVDELFFPSLERLQLLSLQKLKGWWRDDGNSSQEDGELSSPSFPCLSHLKIRGCPYLTFTPLCTSVENLEIRGVPELNLRMLGVAKLRSVRTDNSELLKLGSLTQGYSCLERLFISRDSTLERLAEVEEAFHSCSASLRELEIRYCYNLKSVCGGLEHLTTLERLELEGLPNLSLSKTGERGGEEADVRLWEGMGHSLTSLRLVNLPIMVKLPNGMHHLTNLQSLTIKGCKNLESMPEWMPELTCLRKLHITHCSDSLYERCHNANGEDWQYIQHIPDLSISKS